VSIAPGRAAADGQRALQEAVKQMIVDRGLAPGALLPTETELMQELGVSRNRLREAMKALQAIGIVDIRHGHGTYVGSVSLSALQAGLEFRTSLSVGGDLRDVRDLLHVREVLEAGLVQEVLAVADQVDYATLERAVATMEENARGGWHSPEADWLFHRTLYEPLDNAFVTQLLQVFWSVFNKLSDQLSREIEDPRITARWHRAILSAVRAGDAEAVGTAMRDHFEGIRARLAATPVTRAAARTSPRRRARRGP
jgi:DNA-binding FadR family transcriptional regulator